MAKKKNLSNVNTYLAIALVIVLGISLYFTLSVPTPTKTVAAVSVPRVVQVALLGVDCIDCVNASILVELLKKDPALNVTDVKELSLNDSKELIAAYSINKLPAIVVTGNLTNLSALSVGPAQSQLQFSRSGEAFLFSDSPPPYYDIAAKRVRGKVSVIILADTSCTQCYNLSPAIDQMTKLGMKITSTRTVDSKSDEGKSFIGKYKIEKVPTLIINNEAFEYKIFKDSWTTVGSNESDGKLVLRFVGPPYVNISTGKVDGLAEITYLTDLTCTTCYNVSMFNPILKENFNLQFRDEKVNDIASTRGKLLVRKYNITLVPTVVVSKDAVLYPGLPEVWTKLLGTQEKDGTFVFRQLKLLENVLKQSVSYKDLSSGEIINSSQANAASIENASAVPTEADVSLPSPESEDN